MGGGDPTSSTAVMQNDGSKRMREAVLMRSAEFDRDHEMRKMSEQTFGDSEQKNRKRSSHR